MGEAKDAKNVRRCGTMTRGDARDGGDPQLLLAPTTTPSLRAMVVTRPKGFLLCKGRYLCVNKQIATREDDKIVHDYFQLESCVKHNFTVSMLCKYAEMHRKTPFFTWPSALFHGVSWMQIETLRMRHFDLLTVRFFASTSELQGFRPFFQGCCALNFVESWIYCLQVLWRFLAARSILRRTTYWIVLPKPVCLQVCRSAFGFRPVECSM